MNEKARARLAYVLGALTAGLSAVAAALDPTELPAQIAVGLWLTTTAGVGALIAARRGNNAVGWILVAIGGLGAVGQFAEAYADAAIVDSGPNAVVTGAAWIAHWVRIPAFALFAFLLLLFPTGHPLGPRWRAVMWIAGASIVLGTASVALFPGPVEAVPGIENPLGASFARPVLSIIRSIVPFVELGIGIAGIAAVAMRFRRSNEVARRQIGWLMYAGVLLIATLIFTALATGPLNDASFFAAIAGLLSIPVAIGIAMLRHRLYDIDVVVNRTIVYGALTGGVIAFYIIIVGAMGALFQRRVSLVPSLIATGLVAIGLQPVRKRVQSMVDQLMYGDRKDPYAALAELGRKLEAAFSPDDVLPAIVDTVSRSLKVPFVAIDLHRNGSFRTAAAIGTPTDRTLELPLLYQGSTVGRLVIGERRGDELSRADKALLEDLARQGGVAAHAVGLTEDLRRSREQLLATREEERRRIRRDLHDGLGPELAGIALGLGAARNTLRTDPDRSEQQMAKLEREVTEATRSVRELVEGLRPPTLDELGLVGAIRQKVDSLTAAPGVPRVHVDAADVPSLPAAVEVAAFRIVLEALTNATRHSGAATCTVRLSVEDDLIVAVEDDGKGIATEAPRGVGLASMHERAAELGGSVTIASQPGTGTSITARLPLRIS